MRQLNNILSAPVLIRKKFKLKHTLGLRNPLIVAPSRADQKQLHYHKESLKKVYTEQKHSFLKRQSTAVQEDWNTIEQKTMVKRCGSFTQVKHTHFQWWVVLLDGLDLEMKTDEWEYQALQILDQVVETPANKSQFIKWN